MVETAVLQAIVTAKMPVEHSESRQTQNDGFDYILPFTPPPARTADAPQMVILNIV